MRRRFRSQQFMISVGIWNLLDLRTWNRVYEAWNRPTLRLLWMCAVMNMQTVALLRTKCVKYINRSGNISTDEKLQSLSLCMDCNENQVQVMIVPCKHLSLCEPCANYAIICPICCEVIDGTIRVYVGFNLRKKTM